jgi:hypothetical protein
MFGSKNPADQGLGGRVVRVRKYTVPTRRIPPAAGERRCGGMVERLAPAT